MFYAGSYCMATKEELTNRIKLISKQMSGQIEEGDEEIIPYHYIKGDGDGFFLSYIDRSFVKVARKSEVFIVSENIDNRGRYLVYTYSHELIIIEKEELEYIGFN